MNSFVVRNMARVNRVQCKKYIKNDKFFGLAHTGSVNVAFWKALAGRGPKGVFEVMVHVGYRQGLDPDKTRLVEQRKTEAEALCNSEVKYAIAKAGIELINYRNV